MLDRAAQVELVFCLVAAACAAAVGLMVLARSHRPARNAAAVVVGVLSIALLRGVVTRFSLVHANFHAAEILDDVYSNPTRSTRSYGVFHSLFYGGVMRIFGADLRVVAWTNEIVAAAMLLLMGFVGARYAESRTAFGYVVGLGLMHPVLLRLAGSEEGHNLAVFLSFVALAALEAYRTAPNRAYLVASSVALVLMVATKGIMIASLPCVVAIGLVRSRPEQRRAVLLSVLPLLPMLIVRLPDWWQEGGVFRVAQRMTSDVLRIAVWTHPLLDPRGPFCLVVPLLIAGVVVLLRRSWGTRVIVAALAFLFASSFLLFEGQAVVFTFRLPVLTMAIVVAGIGVASIVDLATVRRPTGFARRWRYPAGALLLIGLTVLSPGFDIVRTVSAQTLEYDFIRSLTPLLPRKLTRVRLPEGVPHPSYAFPNHLVAQAGISSSVATFPTAMRPAGANSPLIFLAGLECWGYSLLEVMPPGDTAAWGNVTYGPTYGEFPRLAGLVIPATERVECRELRRGATRLGAARAISTDSQAEAPFVYYAADTVPLEMLILPTP